MARHKAMRPAMAALEPIPEKRPVPVVPDDGLALSEEGLDPERLARLRKARADQSSPLTREAVRQAAIVWAQTPVRAEATDRNGMHTLVRALVADAEERGSVDASRALRRSAVDRRLARLSRGKKGVTNSARAYKTILYTAGRALRPTEFPVAQAAPGERVKRQAPAGGLEEAEAYASLPSLPEALRRRAGVVLDLVTGAGASSVEVKKVRGSDVRAMSASGRTIAVVRLVAQSGLGREVPVVDEAKAARLLAAAEAAGDRVLLASDRGPGTGRGAVSKVAEEMREHGCTGFNVVRLRRRWMARAAESVPAMAWISLAGSYSLAPLVERPEDVPPVDVERVATLLIAGEEEGE